MGQPPKRKAASTQAPRSPKAKAARPAKRTPEERKAKAVELMLLAVAGGWSLKKFARRSGVSIRSLMRWIAEDTIQDRYFRAMQTKAITLPDEAMELVDLLRRGGETIVVPDEDRPGEFKRVWRPIDPKAIGTALRHYEFRMMREIKALYQPTREIRSINTTEGLSDERIDARFEELMRRAQSDGTLPPPAAEKETAGGS